MSELPTNEPIFLVQPLEAPSIRPELSLPHSSVGRTAIFPESGSSVLEYETPVAPYRQLGGYDHFAFTEQSNPKAARLAWEIHAEGYKAMGFITDEAIVDGILPDDIDKSRGPNTEYRISADVSERENVATMRLEHLSPDQSFRDLPAYDMCKDALSPVGNALLEQYEAQGRPIVEIGAFARKEKAHPISIHKMLGAAFQEGALRNEIWLFSIVTSTFDSLNQAFGPGNFKILGRDVELNAPGVQDVKLRPALIDPAKFYDRLHGAMMAADDPKSRKLLERSFLLYTAGIGPGFMSDEAYQSLKEFRIRSMMPRIGEKR